MKKSIIWTIAIVVTLTAIGTALAGGFSRPQSDCPAQFARMPAVATPAFAQYETNPVVYDSGRYRSGVCTGPFGVRRHVETNRELVHDSAMDPNRGQVDRGSMQRVDGYVTDECGNAHYGQGYRWTSNGVPHSDVNYTQSYRAGRFRTQTDNTHVLKDVSNADE